MAETEGGQGLDCLRGTTMAQTWDFDLDGSQDFDVEQLTCGVKDFVDWIERSPYSGRLHIHCVFVGVGPAPRRPGGGA